MRDAAALQSARIDRDAVPEDHAPLVAFVHPAGLGSLGNAAIIDSFISAVRARIPGVRIIGFTNHPANTKVHHDVEGAFEISSFSMPLYPVVPEAEVVVDQADHPPDDTGRQASGSLLGRVSGNLRLFVRRHRPSSSIFNVVLAAPRLVGEPRALRSLRETLEGALTVVVAGSGQLNAEFGGMFGQPYVLWRFAHTAGAVRARFDVLSVGTGTLGWASRRLVLRALRSARYRSYRDEISRDLLKASKIAADDPIVPDLAYALPFPVPPLHDSSEVCVGISPMNYRHPDFHARGSQSAYENLIGAMEQICVHLLRSGHRVVIFLSDLSDAPARDDLTSRLQRLPSELWSRVTVSQADTVASLWQTYSDLDAVITVRMHAGLLAHVAHRPVLAIEHDRKVATMMAEMGHERYSFDPTNLDEHELIERLDELILNRRHLSEEIATTVDRYRARVEEQYDVVFGRRNDG